MRCKNCGDEFTPRSPWQVFCTRSCMREFYHRRGNHHEDMVDDAQPILRKFDCRTCGKHIGIIDQKDKRTVFCSQQCEKKWWRDITHHGNAVRKRGNGNNGMSGGMSLASLIRREARDLH